MTTIREGLRQTGIHRIREDADGTGGDMVETPREAAQRERAERDQGELDAAVAGGSFEVKTLAEKFVDRVAELLVTHVVRDENRDAKKTAAGSERVEAWKRAAQDMIAEVLGNPTRDEAAAKQEKEREERERHEAAMPESYDEARTAGRGWNPDATGDAPADGGEYERLVAEGGRRW